jgi:hypothetical protein
MYCKICGKEGHYATECERTWSGLGVSNGEGRIERGDTEGQGIATHGTRVSGDNDEGVFSASDRVARWREKNREKYREYMRELMRKKRKKVVDKV